MFYFAFTILSQPILGESSEEDIRNVEYSVVSSTSISVGSNGQQEQTGTTLSSVASEDGAEQLPKRRHDSSNELVENNNHSREALTQDASSHESVIFIGDTSEYVPLTPLRSRLPEDERPDDGDWRLPVDTWDREYRRFRFNTTRVQRKCLQCCKL